MNKFFLPFSVSTLCMMMVACGGGSNNIHENPTVKPTETTAVGCTVASSDACFEFLMEYPVAGLQYTCAKDKINIFSTKLNGNAVTGGCDKDDTATFFLNANDDNRVELGSVKLSDLGVLSADSVPVHLTLLDMAKGITGQAAQSMSTSDETVQVAMNLVKIFQAIGSQKSQTNVVGDIQLVEIDDITLEGLEDITASVTDEDLQTGRYEEILTPWIDTAAISDDQAFRVLKDASNMSLSAIYQADIPVISSAYQGLLGYAGTGDNRRTLMGVFYLMSDRAGFTHGYGFQWRGTPSITNASPATAAVLLQKEVNPLFMHADSQSAFVDPATKRLGTSEKFKLITAQNDTLAINQGKLFNDYAVAGSSEFSKYLTGEDTSDSTILAKWDQSTSDGQYSGGVDFLKAYPIAYLDNRVFKSIKNMKSGEDYYFPLYATLTFEHDDNTVQDIKLGIVIDENGDVRSDIKTGATATDMSGMCGITDSSQATPVDNYGVKQYRLGTIAASNYQPQQGDRSLSFRLVISDPSFGYLRGVVTGLSTIVNLENTNTNLAVKVNIHDLLNTSVQNINAGASLPNINISDSAGAAANWVNFYNVNKSVYLKANATTYTPTTEEADQQKRLKGTLSIDLADCYEVKKKS
ncbi:hypothetical protein MKI79_04855 [Acinetobacter sp. A3.8]|uniref:Protein FilF n=1 Tax=Acinetobacter sedimenti TaxID=2919922 RepID=A0A9X1WYL3_9GAMM|nr:hypothetical protein [Acinetobacter sedimenti]MCJ8146237.1 hypothetical protein [Acinetobacter sedimenti]